MTKKENIASLRLWNRFIKGVDESSRMHIALSFGTLGRAISEFQRGVADYVYKCRFFGEEIVWSEAYMCGVASVLRRVEEEDNKWEELCIKNQFNTREVW